MTTSLACSSFEPYILHLRVSQIFAVRHNFNRLFAVYVVWCKTVARKMIPPNTTLLKYDNPLLVTKNTDKKTPAVRNHRRVFNSDH